MELHDPNGAAFYHATLVDLLRYRAQNQPERDAYCFLQDGEEDEEWISYSELDRRARGIGAWLQEMGAAGERALLLYPAGLDFIAAYFGCLYAGVTAVPVYPPRLNRPSPRIQGIVVDAQARFALTTAPILEKLERRFEHMPELAPLRWLNSDNLPQGLEASWRDPGARPETLAFLQYTSGSTSTPKGVMVSHGNLMHNLEMIRRGFMINHRAYGVFWLPSYHDMGLIGGILEPMYVNGPSVLMEPAAFLQRPARWLWALSRFKGTISGAPNFAYQMCVDKVTPEQCKGLDLSQWEIAFCGAEPIQYDTLRAFAERFAAYGFSSQAFYPCYGLAEGTLLAAGGDGTGVPRPLIISGSALSQNKAIEAAAGAPDAQVLVSSGHALLDQRIVIVDPQTRTVCGPDEVGEIWLAGDSVAQGYWGRPQSTRELFQAYTADSAEGPFLRSGDLGFLRDGELYITGRAKDLIIIRGRNHYPQDIEQTVGQAHEAFEVGMGAAFPVMVDGEERLVVANELKRSHRRADIQEVAQAARKAIAAQHGLQLQAIVLLKPLSIPRTSSGKIKRHACRQGFLESTLEVIGEWRAGAGLPESRDGAVAAQATPEAARHKAVDGGDAAPGAAAIAGWLVQRLAAQLRLPPGQIGHDRPFVEFGLDSVQAVSLTGELESWLGRALPTTLVWDYPTIRDLAAYLAPAEPEPAQQAIAAQAAAHGPIAVVGLSCRFPGAPTPEAFWQLLSGGIDAITEVPAERWDANRYYSPGEDGPAPGKMSTRWGGFVEGVEQFDPHFFNIAPREAERMDPQQRLLLEIAWEALERAGQRPSQLAGSRTGVFVGISSYDYSRLQMSDPSYLDAYAGTGNAHSVAANRLSYTFDLRGPSVAVDTACSSSLVAVHMALQSLRSGESDLAFAAGVNLMLRPELSITFSQARMMAADGRCKTFDAAADGYVRGEGAGLVLLKRLEDARRDGDPVLAVIYGAAVNQDGRSNGLTAPNGLAQQAVIRQALQDAGISAAELTYVEAHGTGTPLGDPIEVHSLRAVLEESERRPERTYLGSVKTNIGHLEAAAGIAGLIKVVLALQHGQIPAHLHFSELNPYIALDGSPLAIAAQAQAWPAEDGPRFAGVSSFGFGGTNAHVIVGDPVAQTVEEDRSLVVQGQAGPAILPLSAKTEAALVELARGYERLLAEHTELPLAAICRAAATGRDHWPYRRALVAADRAGLQQKLQELRALAGGAKTIAAPPSIAFLFTGQGSQFAGMARTLYETQPVFREVLDRCAAILAGELPEPLLDVIFGCEQNDPAQAIHETAYTQPALFAVEVALAELWRSWGIRPAMVLGHSVGEYAAACVAGVFSLEDGLLLIAARGRLMQALPPGGAMAVIFAARQQAEEALAPFAGRVELAAVNGAQSITISGEAGAVETILSRLAAEGIDSRPLSVSHAFHSPLMEPMLDEFEEAARAVTYHAPHTPLISNVTGEPFAPGEAPDAAYWRRHARLPVAFAAGLQTARELGATAFLEMGPQPHLLSMVQRLPGGDAPAQLLLPSLRQKQDERQTMLQALAALYEAGLEVDWAAVMGRGAPTAGYLPTHPFQRSRYWLDVEEKAWSSGAARAVAGRAVRRLPTALPLYETVLGAGTNGGVHEALAADLLAAAGDLWGAGDHQLLSLLHNAALPPAPPLTVQFAVAPQQDDLAFVQFFYRDAELERWLLFGSAQLARGVQTPLAGETKDAAADGGGPTARERLLAESAEQQLAGALDLLRRETAAVLGVAEGGLDVQTSLDSLGLDSLMAIELRNRIEQQMEVSLPVVTLLQGPSVQQLAAQLVAHLADEARQPITRSEHGAQGPAPLSYGQQAMWFLHQLLPDDIAFNVAGAVRLQGALQRPALRRALQLIVQRHAALRMSYALQGGELLQEATEHALPLQEIDAREWPEQRVQAYLEREAHRPFDLQSGPLLRAALLQRAEHEQVLLLSVSHIAADFWSMSLLVQELAQAYETFAAGREPELPEPPLEYVDYVQWQRQMLSGDEGERLRDYWLAQLSGELPLLDLPTDRPRPAQQTYRGDSVSRQLGPQMALGLQRLAQEQGVTLATTLLAAFQALLHRYSGQEDIVVGSVFAGRERPELAPLAGYFVNPVALRAHIDGESSFSAFLQQARQTMLDAFAHQDYPLALLAEQLALQRDPGRPPIFETMFIMQRAQAPAEQGLSALALGLPGAHMTVGDLVVQSLALGGLPAQFDLTLMMAELPEGLAATLHYNSALFDGATAARMLRHLEALLQGILADPEQPIGRIALLLPEEEKLLRAWNQTAAAYAQDRTLAQLFEQQAARTPEAIAAAGCGGALSYRQLDERANRLAQHLRSLGVAPGVFAAVALERSPQMLAALLGVLKAGGAYVPLDPAFPASRLALMVEDAKPRVIITQQSLLQELPPSEAHVVCLDGDWEQMATAPGAGLPAGAGPGDLAYVIYTSGSTGRPKGVQITHRAVVNFLSSMQREPGLEADDVLLAITTLSFDIAVLELFLPLLNGARVVIAAAEQAADGLQLRALVEETDPTVMQATPATWRMLLAAGWQGDPGLKILCGGEALPHDLAAALLERCGELWNMYGPTETTVWSTTGRVRSGQSLLSIGKPIANTQIYILDKAGQPVPIGVAGELVIGGDGLARGYLNRPELTAEKFVQVAHLQPSPLYRTGDLARYDAQGKLYFLGRGDQQVKIRGYRIELGDVEAALSAHEALKEAVVVAAGEGEARRLLAYVVAHEGQPAPSSSELRQWLRQTLPDYMVPASFVALDALPLTPNNKVDRRALPAPASGEPQRATAYVAPRSALEAELAELCAAVLKLAPGAPVGIHDDFFDLGGTSLLATRLIFEVRERYGAQVPLRRLFSQPTIAGLAQAVEGGVEEEADPWHMSTAQLKAEARLDETITAAGRQYEQPASLKQVLLTGATGFLGAFLLHDLLQQTGATVHCLVRAANAQQGLRRLRSNLQSYELWQEELAGRIVVVPGDLAEPRLGLSEAQFLVLARDIDAIIHNGALVNFVHPYAAHKAANVLGTQEILRLAALQRLQAVHFVSTLSVFHTGGHDDGMIFAEGDDLEEVGAPFGGYAQSKWAAEQLVMEAARRGLPVAIYRPGLVSGSAATGAWNMADMMTTLARASLAMGLAPQLDIGDRETQIDIVPVDYVSRAIVALAQRERAEGQVYHLNNPQPLPYRRLLELAPGLGLQLTTVSFDEWRSRLAHAALRSQGDGAASFLPLLEEVSAEQVFMPAFDCRNTLAGLAGSGVACPPVRPVLLQTYFDYFRRKGYLAAPALEAPPMHINGKQHKQPAGDRRR